MTSVLVEDWRAAQALAMLRTVRKSADPRMDLVMLALAGRSKNFDKVLKMIDEMVALLGKEQAAGDRARSGRRGQAQAGGCFDEFVKGGCVDGALVRDVPVSGRSSSFAGDPAGRVGPSNIARLEHGMSPNSEP